MIKVSQLNKYFNRRKRNEIHVLNDVSLELPQKGLIVLLGPSGSGKTTLLNVIGGLDKVQSGQIDIKDKSIKGYQSKSWDLIRNESIGYIFQNYNLLPELSVYDNIAFVLKMIGITDKEEIDTRVLYILKAVGMYPFRKKKALQLSGGQQQRVAIARALVKNPDIIIADEPTGNLDSKNTLDVMNIIKSISREKLVVLVTHEKDMAKFYGDRIIELKDGQIVNDTYNEEQQDHSMAKDDTIYLKDLKQLSRVEDGLVKVEMFSDHDDDKEELSVKFIIKNKTLYIDVDSSYKKIKLADQSSGVVIKDEHYTKKTREELIETTFDTNILNNEKLVKQKRSMVSLKHTFLYALQKIIRTSKKGKLMLFSFLIAGAVIAVTVGILSATLIIEPESNMAISKGYTRVLNNQPTFDQVMTMKTDQNEFRLHPYGVASLNFTYPGGFESPVSIYGQIENVDLVSTKDIKHGRKPANPYEIMISHQMAEDIIKGSQGQEFGIWTIQNLYSETLRVHGRDLKIVGIVDTEIQLIYMSESLAFFTSFGSSLIPLSMMYDLNLTHGQLPVAGQILVPYDEFIKLRPNPNNYTFPYSITEGQKTTIVSGLYLKEGYENIVIIPDEDLTKVAYNQAGGSYIYSNNSKKIIEDLKAFNSMGIDVYQQAYDQISAQRQTVLISTISTSSVLIGFALLGFYFVIRSSLISRIYEVSVYRALGVKKGDIFRSFLVEIIVITTISTMIGFVLANMAMMRLQEGLLGMFNFFKVTPLTFILGIALSYVLNIAAGLFPVFMLLRKTPAQILSQYDI